MSHQYATVEDLQRLAVPAVVLRDNEDPDIDRALIAATSKADSTAGVARKPVEDSWCASSEAISARSAS